MNLSGYNELTTALDTMGVCAEITECPREGEDLRFFTMCYRPDQTAASVLNALVMSEHIRTSGSRTLAIGHSPELRVVSCEKNSILFEDTNAQPSGSYEVR